MKVYTNHHLMGGTWSRLTWSPDHLPSLAGKVALVTGGDSGIGLECARALGAKSAHVVIVGRHEDHVDK